MRVIYQNREAVVPENATAGEALAALGALTPGVLAAMAGGRALDLSEPLPSDGPVSPLTLADEEGQRIYERSLRFVLLMALKSLCPGRRVRIEHSIPGGVLVRLPGFSVTEDFLARLKGEMQRLVTADLPFTRKRWSREEAIRYFEEDGQPDKVALLRTRPYTWFNMYSCGGMWEYFYGAMAPSTGAIPVFDLHRKDGECFALLMPSDGDWTRPTAYRDQPKHYGIYAQSAHWCAILGVNNLADLTRLRDEHGFREFIRVNELLHDLAMGEIAKAVVEGGKRVVLVAGPSSSGKTTFAGRMAVHLRVLGRRAWRLSLDDYYLDRDAIAPGPDGTIDLEHLNTLDLPRLQSDINRLLAGEEVEIPRFSFVTGKREPKGQPLRLEKDELVIIEGIHALNPLLSEGVPEHVIHRIFVSALTCLNMDDHNRIRTTDVRLLRRIVRDNRFRGTPPEKTLAMWPSVRRGEETWIFPCQERADSVFNTTLHYELPILRRYAYDLLHTVAPEAEGFLMAQRLIKMLHYVPDAGEEILREIPPLSLLREFIGGCTIDED